MKSPYSLRGLRPASAGKLPHAGLRIINAMNHSVYYVSPYEENYIIFHRGSQPQDLVVKDREEPYRMYVLTRACA